MERSKEWQEVVGAVIKSLRSAPDAASREAAVVWEWVFERLEQHPDDFNSLQESQPEKLDELVKLFLTTAEARAKREAASDTALVEKAVSYSLPIDEAPAARRISREVADALAAFGVFLGHQGHNVIDTPSRLPYASALFGLHDQVFEDILASKQVPEQQKTILRTVAKHLPRGDEARSYFERVEAATKIERLFGFSRRLLAPTDVYSLGREFYRLASRLGPTTTVTISNTSGLWNPHERLGTAEFIRSFGRRPDARMGYKDGHRATNFTHGILQGAYACSRIYLFNSESTWRAFRQARDAAERRDAFEQYARQLVEEVCLRMQAVPGTLHLVSVENFSKCAALALVTRASQETLMFSNRGSDLSIVHAFWCDLRPTRTTKTLGGAARILKGVADLVSGGVLTALGEVLPLLEQLYARKGLGTGVVERFAGERIRGVLDAEPAKAIRRLEERFGLELNYVTAPVLKAQLEENLVEAQ